MKALERYIKKSGKAPFGKTKAKGKMEGEPKGKDQFASTKGKPVEADSTASGESDLATGGIGAYESVRGYKGKKGKQRSYLNC